MSKLLTVSRGPAAPPSALNNGYNQFWLFWGPLFRPESSPDAPIAWFFLTMRGEEAGDPLGETSFEEVTDDKEPERILLSSCGLKKRFLLL